MEKKTDRRIRKTKQQLQEGFIHLRKTKSIKYITVKELCELTDLNRGTFYLHYRDIYDLSEQMENEIILKFEELLNLSTAEVANNPQLVICKTFELIKQNADFCTCLLSNNGEMTFFNKLKTIIRDACFKYWTELFSRPKKVETFDYFFNFMLYGCIMVLLYCIRLDLILYIKTFIYKYKSVIFYFKRDIELQYPFIDYNIIFHLLYF